MARSIFITGCSTGIGLEAAKTLHGRGYQVFASARHTDDVEKLKALDMPAVQCDVSDSDSIDRAVEQVLQTTGGTLDALFNNAGYGQMGAMEDISREAMRKQFETNVFGLLELTNKIIPVMRKQGHGRIINVSSVLGLVSMPYRGAYNASKYAVEALSDAMRIELRPDNIQVSLIEPGPIVSQFRNTAIVQTEQQIDELQSQHKQHYLKMKQEAENMTKDNSMFTLTPEAVIKKVIHALESPKPKARYFVTKATYLMVGLKWLLPIRAMDWVLQRIE